LERRIDAQRRTESAFDAYSAFPYSCFDEHGRVRDGIHYCGAGPPFETLGPPLGGLFDYGKIDAAVELRICKPRCTIPFDSELILDRWTRRFIMAKPISDDTAFAKHFIDSAQILLAGEKFMLAIQNLRNAIDSIKALHLKKKADGAE
jgi:hypothetical protein